jgi:hypothetical protein
MTFMMNPVLAISVILIYPEPKTMAFGGVATGSMKAQLAAIQEATINAYGCTFMATDRDARMGSKMDAVATLEVISVRKFTRPVINNSIRNSSAPFI